MFTRAIVGSLAIVLAVSGTQAQSLKETVSFILTGKMDSVR
jgi:hypothetical protein